MNSLTIIKRANSNRFQQSTSSFYGIFLSGDRYESREISAIALIINIKSENITVQYLSPKPEILTVNN